MSSSDFTWLQEFCLQEQKEGTSTHEKTLETPSRIGESKIRLYRWKMEECDFLRWKKFNLNDLDD